MILWAIIILGGLGAITSLLLTLYYQPNLNFDNLFAYLTSSVSDDYVAGVMRWIENQTKRQRWADIFMIYFMLFIVELWATLILTTI